MEADHKAAIFDVSNTNAVINIFFFYLMVATVNIRNI